MRPKVYTKMSAYTVGVQAVLDTEAAVYSGQEPLMGLHELVNSTDAISVRALHWMHMTRLSGGHDQRDSINNCFSRFARRLTLLAYVSDEAMRALTSGT